MGELGTPPDYPVGATARRPSWSALPPEVRKLIEVRCGASVLDAQSVPSGFTAGFASRLRLADGSSVFVKAATTSEDAFTNHAVAGYREEARKLALLPPGLPVPQLRWTGDLAGWTVLCFNDVGGRPPRRPWDPAELDRALDCLDVLARELTPAPPGEWVRFVDEFAGEVARWDRLDADSLVGAYADRARTLAADGLRGLEGGTLVHCDLRDDNVVVGADGQVWVCDWNWPVLGAPWIDTVTLLISARGDGIDVDRLLTRRPSTRSVAAEAVDGLLALLLGYWQVVRHDPVPESSPWVRRHQRWYGAVTWGWLCQRRGWR